ncbi:MAG: hypothetical protein HY875_03525 [Chloroflexi bacterium]|nr:hypothetical protein [Chloroflexota bacterium]
MKVRGHRAWLPAAVIVAAVFGLRASAYTPNLLTNGTFDTVVAPWAGAVGWKALDASGSPASGSARVTNTYDVDYEAWAYGQQCIATIVPGARYTISGQVMVPSGQPLLLGVGIDTQGFSEPGCHGNGSLGGLDAFADLSVVDVWQSLSVTSSYKPEARSIMVYLEVGKHPSPGIDTSADAVWARFDNIFLAQAVAGEFRLVVPGIAKD